MSDPAREYVPFSPNLLLRALSDSQRAEPQWPRAITLLLDRSFRVSLYKDEGRPLRFSLALTPPDVTLPSEEMLAPSVDATASALRRLAVAAEPSTSCLHVACSDEGGAPRVRIVGLCARPELMEAPGGGQVLLIDVTDPACVSLRSPRVEVRYERDAWYVPRGRAVLERLLPSDVENAALRLFEPEMRGSVLALPGSLAISRAAWPAARDAFFAEVVGLTRSSLAEGLAMIVEEVKRLGHGGTLVVLPEAGRDGMGRLKLDRIALDAHRFEPARRGPASEPWNRGLVESLAWTACRNLALRGIPLAEDASESQLPDWAIDVAHERTEAAMVRWRADARRIAWLTQIDGAVVLDALLQPLLFGLKITLDNSAFLPEAWREFLVTRGTRHRATACIADALGESIALAISQDGGVTVFRKEFREAVVETVTI